MVIRQGNLKPSECMSMDQCMSVMPGHHADCQVRGKGRMCYSGGTMFINHASGFMHSLNKVSLQVGETLPSKNEFEQFTAQHGVKITNHQTDE